MTIEELTFEAFKQGREQGREESSAQIERLRGLVKEAYLEGWNNADDPTTPDFNSDWRKSDTRAALQPKEG